MTIILGSHTFDPINTVFQETCEELGGRDARIIRVTGLLAGASVDALEQELDTLLSVASPEAAVTSLSLRPGRRLWVRRLSFTREIQRESCSASFKLELEAPDPCEESIDACTAFWDVTESGEAHELSVGGNRWAPLHFAISAVGTLKEPGLGDGLRQIAYGGELSNGQTLICDGPANRVTLDDVDVTPLCTGVFPRLQPGTTTLTFFDASDSAHTAHIAATWRERWW